MQTLTPMSVAPRRSLFPFLSAFLAATLFVAISVPVYAGGDILRGQRMAYKRDPAAVNAGFSHDGNNCAVVGDKEFQSGGGSALIIAPDAYSYSVVGSGCGHTVYGVLNADGNGGVSGFLYLENGEQTTFYGDWVGDGIAEGVDNSGNLFTVRVDN